MSSLEAYTWPLADLFWRRRYEVVGFHVGLDSRSQGSHNFHRWFVPKTALTIPAPPTNPWLIWILSMVFLAFETKSSLIRHTSDLQVNHFNPWLQVTIDKRKLFYKNIFNLNPLWQKGGSHHWLCIKPSNLTCDRCSLPGLCCYRHRGKDGGIRGWGWWSVANVPWRIELPSLKLT